VLLGPCSTSSFAHLDSAGFFEGAQLIRPSRVILRHIERLVTGERSDGLDGDAYI
jgi:hypothetical protein